MNNNVDEILKNAKNNSIGSDKKHRLIRGTKKVAPKALLILVATVMAVNICACSSLESNMNFEGTPYDIEEQIDYKEGYSIAVDKMYIAKRILKENGVDIAKSNEVSTYAKISELREDDLIGYYKLLGEKETEKILQALGYEGWNDFLTKQECFDKDGKPSRYVWERKTYVEYGKQYEDTEDYSK